MSSIGPSSSWSRSLDTAQRAAEVVSALARFGFGQFMREVGLDKFLLKGEARGEGPDGSKPLPVRVRLLVEELGPTFIKVGQILSTRPDLVPADWVDELAKLQSEVPPAAWDGDDGVRQLLEDELGDLLETAFEHIEPRSFAAASMAQVHRARLTGGQHIVLKVLRPGIREQMIADLDLMRMFGRLTRSYFKNMGFDVDAVIDEFSRQLERETDLAIEALSTLRMRRDFEDHPGVTFPAIYEDVSTRSILAMEEVEGTLLAKLDRSTLTLEQRETIVRNGADMVFQQCLIIGFFHADPHPGNIFVLEDQRLCFIDCGMTGLIDPGSITQLAQLVHGAIDGDLNRVIRVAIQIAEADRAIADNRAFRADVWQFVDGFHGGTLDSIRMGEMLSDFFAILRKYKLRCPADIVYLIKALTTIEGVAKTIAPDFDLITHVRPYVERLIRQRYSFGALKERFESSAIAYGDLIEELPGEISELLKAARQNKIGLQLEHRGLVRLTGEIERASMNVSWSLVVGSLIVGAAVLVLADNLDRSPSYLTTIATGAFVVAFGIGLMRLLRLRRGAGD